MDGAIASAWWHAVVAEFGVGDVFDSKSCLTFSSCFDIKNVVMLSVSPQARRYHGVEISDNPTTKTTHQNLHNS